MRRMPSDRYACISLLSSDDYAIGAEVLGWTLRQSGWPWETVLMVTAPVSPATRQTVARQWQKVVEVEPLQAARGAVTPWSPAIISNTKLRAWSFEEYRRVIFIDADTIVTGPLTELIERPSFAAAPCLWPPDRFNSGVMVIEPSRAELDRMLEKTESLSSYDGSDQGFLNSYFSDWFSGPAEHRLPAKFNASQFLYLYAPAWYDVERDLRIIHFTGPRKPWKSGGAVSRGFWRWLIRRWMEVPKDRPMPSDLWWDAHDAMKKAAT